MLDCKKKLCFVFNIDACNIYILENLSEKKTLIECILNLGTPTNVNELWETLKEQRLFEWARKKQSAAVHLSLSALIATAAGDKKSSLQAQENWQHLRSRNVCHTDSTSFQAVFKHPEYEKLFTACNEKQIWVERCLGELRLGLQLEYIFMLEVEKVPI